VRLALSASGDRLAVGRIERMHTGQPLAIVPATSPA